MTSPVNQGSIRHQAWGLMCGRQMFTCREIALLLNMKTNRIVGFTRTLIRNQAVEIFDRRDKSQGVLYRVCIEQGSLTLPPPKVRRKERRKKGGTRSQQIWNAIRIHKGFTMELLQTTTCSTSLSLLNNYVWHLEQCGFIRRQGRYTNQAGYSCVKYRLINDIGRLYPRTQKQGMWDQNSNTFFPFKESGDE
jgi:hypothetical protein